jgi:hypothetical protein
MGPYPWDMMFTCLNLWYIGHYIHIVYIYKGYLNCLFIIHWNKNKKYETGKKAQDFEKNIWRL